MEKPQPKPSFSNLWNREPVVILAFVRAVLYGGAYFGLDLSEPQILGIVAVVETLLVIITRQNVVSPATNVAEVKEALYKAPPVQNELVTEEAAL
jgi:hypothetical protein